MLKKFVSLCIMSGFLSASALCYQGQIEHLEINKQQRNNLVNVTPYGSIIQRGNYLVVNFAQNFNSKYYKHGDYIQFTFDHDIMTSEGTMLIPKEASLVARISELQDPEWFSKNAKVFLEFISILMPDGEKVPVALSIAGKKRFLQKGARATAGKIAAYTLSIGAAGSGIGAAIGTAAGNTVTGLIVGGSIGGGVGLVTGIVSPGLHYKAKQGQPLILRVSGNLAIPNNSL